VEHALTVHDVGVGESVEELLAADRQVREMLEKGAAAWIS
jgi:hypothetical protein